ncbi:hypothetical protein [Nocardia sp. NPDC050710]|uniref:WXG100 family type VII secretion target n=1 Tax=Nocardia sp. NPDC050710 TaxID=3157220 RepID=UPI0033E4F3AE
MISYKYAAVSSNALTFGNIVTQITNNNNALRGLESGLKGAFTGEAADTGWHPQIDRLMGKIDEYSNALGNLKTVIDTVAGEAGTMHITDKDQGGRFLALKI